MHDAVKKFIETRENHYKSVNMLSSDFNILQQEYIIEQINNLFDIITDGKYKNEADTISEADKLIGLEKMLYFEFDNWGINEDNSNIEFLISALHLAYNKEITTNMSYEEIINKIYLDCYEEIEYIDTDIIYHIKKSIHDIRIRARFCNSKILVGLNKCRGKLTNEKVLKEIIKLSTKESS